MSARERKDYTSVSKDPEEEYIGAISLNHLNKNEQLNKIMKSDTTITNESSDNTNSDKKLSINPTFNLTVNTTINEKQAKIDTSSSPIPSPTNSDVPPREKWSKKMDFIFSCIGYSVGLGNMWRFPYICYKNGGGAFLIPYLLSLIFAGIPIFLLELSLGQYLSVGGLGVWKITPAFKGVGYAAMVTSAWLNIYYIVVLAWALYYLVSSFTLQLPWSTCGNHWNTPSCRSFYLKDKDNFTEGIFANKSYGMKSEGIGESARNDSSEGFGINGTNWGSESWRKNGMCDVNNYTSPVQEFWEHKVLKMSRGLEEPGSVHWELAATLLFAWVVCYFCIWKGVKWTGKITWFTSTTPYILLFILFLRGISLPGAYDGIVYYLKPDFSRLTESEVWNDAVTQIFFSYGLVLGTQIALGSYNSYHNNVLKDALVISVINSCTSLFSGFVIFSVLGYMAQEQGREVKDVVKSGPGLAFLAYPSAISQMPLSPLWSVLFFSTLFFVGLDSQFCTIEGFVTAIVDEWPSVLRKRKEWVALVTCVVSYLIGLSMVTQGGIYVFELLNHFSASGLSLMILVFFECIAISWSYGVRRYVAVLKDMIGYQPSWWWSACWLIFTPVVCFVNLILAIVLYKEVSYNDYRYPAWGVKIGWTIMLSSLSLIPLYAVYLFIVTPGPFMERIKKICRPYVPDEPINLSKRLDEKEPMMSL